MENGNIILNSAEEQEEEVKKKQATTKNFINQLSIKLSHFHNVYLLVHISVYNNKHEHRK